MNMEVCTFHIIVRRQMWILYLIFIHMPIFKRNINWAVIVNDHLRCQIYHGPCHILRVNVSLGILMRKQEIHIN